MRTRLLLRLAFGFVILGVLFRAAYLLHSLDDAFARADEVVRTQERRATTADRALAVAVDLETGVRGWALTHERSFREPFDRASGDAPRILAELEQAYGHDDGPRVAAVRSALAEWEARVARPILAGTTTDAESVALHEEGKRRLDGIRADLAALRASAVQKQGNDLLHEQIGRGVVVDIVTFTAGLVLAFFGLGVAVVRMIEHPLARLADVATGVAPVSALEDIGGVREVRALARAVAARESRLQEDRAREKRFADMLGVLAEGGELAAVASAALRNVVDDRHVLFGTVWILRRGLFERVAVTGLAAELPATHPPAVEEACRTGRTITLRDPGAAGSLVLRTTAMDVVPRRVLVAPLLVGGQAVGAVELGGDISDDAAEELHRVLPRVALALANGVAVQEVAKLGESLARTNEELYAQNEELRAQEDELRAQRELLLANEARLSRQTTELEHASQAKTEFLSTVSHELRTPLNAIVGFTEVLMDGKDAEVSPVRRRYLRDVQDAARHLHKLVDDLLDLSRVEAGVLEVRTEAVDVREKAERALALVRPDAERKRILTSCDVAGELACIGDARRVKQVLTNLLTNAIKFSPEGGLVALRAEARDGWAWIEVTDSGPGIAPADVPRLFQQFTQLAEGVAAKSGFGLGLAISKRLVERMGGRIGVRSRADGKRGAVFVVELPLASASGEAVPRPLVSAPPVSTAKQHVTVPLPKRTTPKPPAGARRAVVVSSGKDEVDVLRDLLAREGYAVESVGAETSAVFEALEREACTVAIVDLGTPSAGEVLAKVAARAAVPIVALTDASLDARAAHELRAQGVLVIEKGVMTGAGFTDLLSSASSRTEHPLVLVVDDNDVNRRIARVMLEDARYRVVEADGAEAAYELARRLQPDVVLMDIRMPGTNGIEATRRLRAERATAAIPVIALSAQAMVGDQAHALEAGCVAYVTKPVGRQELISAVSRAMGAAVPESGAQAG